MTAIDEIKERVDIVEFIGRYVQLKRAGSTYKGLCPFHDERTPSFVVFPHSGTWRCFGACGIGGDVFAFLMQREHLDFREALQTLANEYGVTLEEANAESQDERARLYAINEAAATYFQEILRHHQGAQAARAYLERRGIDGKIIDHFRIGFALDTWSGLRDFLSERGWSLEEQLQAGLTKRHEERNSVYDAFRGRVMIPICDRQGRVIGFGGRVLGDGQPKYLNTAETPLFQKSHVIFGLDRARETIRTADQVVIVEGYMDVIAAHQHGFTNVVACMGTSLTSDQLQQLHRFTNNFILALDADAAGQQATVRGLNQARQSLLRVQKPTVTASGQVRLTERLSANLAIVSMPDGQDPDDVIRQTPEIWRQLVEKAQPLVDFYLRFVAQQYDLQSAQGKGLAVAEVAPLIAELDDEIERQHYIQQLSRQVQIDELTILSRVQAAAKTSNLPLDQQRKRSVSRFGAVRNRNADDATTAGDQSDAAHRKPREPKRGDRGSVTDAEARRGKQAVSQEDHLMTNLLREPSLLVWLSTATARLELMPLDGADWQSILNQEIFKALRYYMQGDELWDWESFQELLTPHLHGHLAHLLNYGAQLPHCDTEQLRWDTVSTLIHLRIQQLRTEARNIQFLQDDAARQGDMQAAKQFAELSNQQIRDLFHLQQSQHSLSKLFGPNGVMQGS
ncbi:MAG: DNA primase [Caldilineaceae bacterium]|nr:DNA primase [Caldilineaceae bacterium]